MIRVLVDAGANVDARDDDQCTPLHLAAMENGRMAAWRNPSADVIRALVEAGADLEACDDDQWTPLHMAAGYNQGAVKVLIELGASVNVLNRAILASLGSCF